MAMTVIIPSTSKASKQKLARAASGQQFVTLVAEHVYGDAFCRNYAPGLDEVAAEHAQWVQVLKSETERRGAGAEYNEGVKLALARLPRGTGIDGLN
jgi:hypothetical protein